MLPPVLDVYVIYHPLDTRGTDITAALVQHFHGTAFSGLLGGGIEVYVRTSGWRSQADAPRPIPAVAQEIFEKTQAPRDHFFRRPRLNQQILVDSRNGNFVAQNIGAAGK